MEFQETVVDSTARVLRCEALHTEGIDKRALELVWKELRTPLTRGHHHLSLDSHSPSLCVSFAAIECYGCASLTLANKETPLLTGLLCKGQHLGYERALVGALAEEMRRDMLGKGFPPEQQDDMAQATYRPLLLLWQRSLDIDVGSRSVEEATVCAIDAAPEFAYLLDHAFHIARHVAAAYFTLGG